MTKRTKRITAGVVCLLFGALIALQAFLPKQASAAAPNSPPVEICGNPGILNGPSTAPGGAVTVPAGNNGSLSIQDNKTYWFAPGTHTLGTGPFNQLQAHTGDTFVGAPGAVLDGQGLNQFAILADDSSVTDVTISYLTIQNFAPPGSQGAVNQNSNPGWTIMHDTITNNLPGAAMMVGSSDDIEYNCLTGNGQYAFNAYIDSGAPSVSALTSGPHDITISNNEISYNNVCNWEDDATFPITPPAGCADATPFDGCGCTGGGKFWAVDQATYDNNYVHDNYSVGMWADTNNTGFDVEGNYFANNAGQAIIYEISYNAVFKDNTFVGNALHGGPLNPGFPSGAIYISESGGDSRVAGFSSGALQITGNIFTNNYSGVVLWENSDRFCSSDANTSSGYCTLVNPTVANITTCADSSLIGTTPYINDCRWKTQNVSVDHNVFNMSRSAVTSEIAGSGSTCTIANDCGLNALFAQYGSFTPYQAWPVPTHISNTQNNSFNNNTYNGDWNFMAFNQGDQVSYAQWTAGFNDNNGSGVHFNTQDASSTSNTAVPDTAAPSAPGSTSATANSPTSVTVSWTASTDTGTAGMGGYYIYRNGLPIGTAAANATSYNDTTTSGSTTYYYSVHAFDMLHNLSGVSSLADVTTPSSQDPVVSFNALSAGAHLHGNAVAVATTATPFAGHAISQAILKVDGTTTQTLTSSPFNFTLNTIPYHNGSHILTTQATDNSSLIGSTGIGIIVTNADLNSDNQVSLSDLILLASHWNQNGTTYIQGDVNGDGNTNLSDLIIMANNWSTSW